MTDTIARLEELDKARTPGNWLRHYDGICSDVPADCLCANFNHGTRHGQILTNDTGVYGPCEPDMEWILALAKHAKALLKVARIAEDCKKVWDAGLEVQPGSALAHCMTEALAELSGG